jgi:hypothetical protein
VTRAALALALRPWLWWKERLRREYWRGFDHAAAFYRGDTVAGSYVQYLASRYSAPRETVVTVQRFGPGVSAAVVEAAEHKPWIKCTNCRGDGHFLAREEDPCIRRQTVHCTCGPAYHAGFSDGWAASKEDAARWHGARGHRLAYAPKTDVAEREVKQLLFNEHLKSADHHRSLKNKPEVQP